MTSTTTRLPTIQPKLTEIDLCGWLGQTSPGEAIEYHRGFLAVDIIPHGSRLPEKHRLELGRIARRAWWASERGLAHLIQRRHGPDDYSYIIVARPRSPSKPLSELFSAEVG